MFDLFDAHPGLLFVVATLLPLAAFTVLLLAGALRTFLRSRKTAGGPSEALYEMLGGEATGRGPAWIATAGIGLACVCCLMGFVLFLAEHHVMHDKVTANKNEIKAIEITELAAKAEQAQDKKQDASKGK